MQRVVLFDLDGTLTDPGLGITNSVMYALEKFSIRVEDRRELYKFIGPPLLNSFMNFYGFDEEQAEQAVVYYREYFKEKGIFENKVYDGIPELLEQMKKEKMILVVATSKCNNINTIRIRFVITNKTLRKSVKSSMIRGSLWVMNYPNNSNTKVRSAEYSAKEK